MNYIRITKENIDKEHICCAMSGKQSVAKKDWLRQRCDDGLVFYRSEERGKCFIEYIPAENAWVPIEADGYLYIAIALSGNPDFLVLDEPTNGLDPQGIIEMRELILKLNREHGITVLISSHILDELSRLATHYGFINGGHMVKEMSAQELETRCRKCVRIEVSDTKALARVLDGMKAEYRIIDDTHADIYAEIPVTELVSELAKENFTVKNLTEQDESLESFYMNLVGGKHHA